MHYTNSCWIVDWLALSVKGTHGLTEDFCDSYVNDAIFPELDTELNCPALVTALGCRLEKVISIDNGIMHMLSLSNVQMIVLFGPTNSKKFAPNKKEVTVIDSKTVYKSDDISKISIEDVFKNI